MKIIKPSSKGVNVKSAKDSFETAAKDSFETAAKDSFETAAKDSFETAAKDSFETTAKGSLKTTGKGTLVNRAAKAKRAISSDNKNKLAKIILSEKDNSSSVMDIFQDDESWNKKEFSRSSPDQFKNKKTNGITKTVSGNGVGSNKKKSRKVKPIKRSTAASKQAKLDKLAQENELNEPLENGKKRRRSELGVGQVKSALEQLIDPDKKEFNAVLSRGIKLLAIREHSVLEITNKLIAKFSDYEDVDATLVHAVVDELVTLKYVSDERFSESYVRSRSNKGFGPVKIKAELKGKGVSSNLIQDHLKEGSGHWFDKAEQQYVKKYGDGSISDYNTWTKRARFMQSRGFTMEHIHVTLPKVEFD